MDTGRWLIAPSTDQVDPSPMSRRQKVYFAGVAIAVMGIASVAFHGYESGIVLFVIGFMIQLLTLDPACGICDEHKEQYERDMDRRDRREWS